MVSTFAAISWLPPLISQLLFTTRFEGTFYSLAVFGYNALYSKSLIAKSSSLLLFLCH